MGQPQQMAPSNQNPTTPNICQTGSEEENIEWGNVRKFHLTSRILEDKSDILQDSINVIYSLSKLSLPVELIKCKTCWIEGHVSEKLKRLLPVSFNNFYEIATDGDRGNDHSSTNFCVILESPKTLSLKDFLDYRTDKVFLRVQINNVISQLLTVINFFLEKELNMFEMNNSKVYITQEDKNAYSHQPIVKVDCFDLERRIEAHKEKLNPKSNNEKTKVAIEFISSLFVQLLESTVIKSSNRIDKEHNNISLESVFPHEWKLIQKLKTTNEFTTSLIMNIIEELTEIGKNLSTGLTLNVQEASATFVGRQGEIEKIIGLVNERKESCFIILHGGSGVGKTELVYQVSKNIIEQHQDIHSSSIHGPVNIICVNGSSTDSITTSIYSCASHSQLQVPVKDYIYHSKCLKDIFYNILQFFNGKRLLIVLENICEPTADISDLLEVFQNNTKSEQSHCMMIVVSDYLLWKKNEMLAKAITISLESFTDTESIDFLQKKLNVTEDERNYLSTTLQNHPASLYLATKYCKIDTFSNFKIELSVSTELLKNKFNECHDRQRIAAVVYLSSLRHLYKSFRENELYFAKIILEFLQHFDGELGISFGVLTEVMKYHPKLQTKTEIRRQDIFKTVVISLGKFSLIEYRDEIIRMSPWMKFSLRESLCDLNPSIPVEESSADLLIMIRNQMNNTKEEIICSSNQKNSEITEMLPSFMKIWTNLTKSSKPLAKQFEGVPEQIAKLGKMTGYFETTIGFLKQATDILAQASSNSYDLHCLKIKYLLAMESLLPKNKVNEAFIIFKTCQEQCRTEPRGFLMLKLKSLIAQGKIHITRREFEKGMSCFQQVQIFAVQKIATIELDSEPVILHARMLAGHVFLLQNNFGESKKILLQVIPLMERYAGGKADHVRMLLLEARFHLSCLLRKSGDLVNALMMQTKVLDEKLIRLGPKHPETWASKQEMAMLFSSYDNHEKALTLLREVLEIQEEILGAPSNRQSLTTMNAIAEIELKLGNFDDALELYEAIDLIQQEVLSDQDAMRVTTQLNQAEVLMSLGQYKEAVDIFELLYALCSTSEDKTNVGILCESILSKKEKASRCMEILGNYWLSLTPENVDDHTELGALAKKHEVAMELSENQDNYGALRFLREILEDSVSLEETNRFLLNVKADLARVLGLVGKFNESFSVFKEIIPLMDATFGEADELTMLCKDTMGQVFLFSGNQFLKRQMSNLKWFLL